MGVEENVGVHPTVTLTPASSMQIDRRLLGATLVTGSGLVFGCALPADGTDLSSYDADTYAYASYEVDLGQAARQTVVTGFLLEGRVAELAVVNVDKDGDRRLRVFALGEETWELAREGTLRSQVTFVDVAQIDGVDRLVTYEPGRLNWWDPRSGLETELLSLSSSFHPPRANEVPHVDITQDLNGDGRDDFVMPDGDGFWVVVQLDSGRFGEPVRVGPTAELSCIYGADGYRYDPWSQSRVHVLDCDGDGRKDLVSWSGGRFEVHTLTEEGLFSPEAKMFTTDVAFGDGTIASLASGDKRGRVMHSLADMNEDGVADLTVFSLEGDRDSRKRSMFEVHFGERAGQEIAFSPDVGLTFESEDRIQLGIERGDFDGDARIDSLLTTIDVGALSSSPWKKWKGFFGDDIWLNLEFFRADAPGEPATVRRLQLDGPPSSKEAGWVPLEVVLRGATHERRRTQEGWTRAFNTTLRVGDVNGDGRSDLLMSDHPRSLRLYLGVDGPEFFSERGVEVAHAVPNDEEYTWLVDLDRDGKQDVLMHHPFVERNGHGARKLPPGKASQRVTVLLSK